MSDKEIVVVRDKQFEVTGSTVASLALANLLLVSYVQSLEAEIKQLRQPIIHVVEAEESIEDKLSRVNRQARIQAIERKEAEQNAHYQRRMNFISKLNERRLQPLPEPQAVQYQAPRGFPYDAEYERWSRRFDSLAFGPCNRSFGECE